jgi:hypothetical protein
MSCILQFIALNERTDRTLGEYMFPNPAAAEYLVRPLVRKGQIDYNEGQLSVGPRCPQSRVARGQGHSIGVPATHWLLRCSPVPGLQL